MIKVYGKRDVKGSLMNLFMHHLASMTAEGLHEKADIAAELAYRDSRIEKLNSDLIAVEHQRDQAINDYDDAMHAVARLEKQIEEKLESDIGYFPEAQYSSARESIKLEREMIEKLKFAQQIGRADRRPIVLIDEISDFTAEHVEANNMLIRQARYKMPTWRNLVRFSNLPEPLKQAFIIPENADLVIKPDQIGMIKKGCLLYISPESNFKDYQCRLATPGYMPNAVADEDIDGDRAYLMPGGLVASMPF
jgi:hypothetical protein